MNSCGGQLYFKSVHLFPFKSVVREISDEFHAPNDGEENDFSCPMESSGDSLSNITTIKHLTPRPEGREGMMNIGNVVFVQDPSEFYIFPARAWECACKEVQPSRGDESGNVSTDESKSPKRHKGKLETSKSAIVAFNEMLAELSHYLGKPVYADTCGEQFFRKDDLLAVQLPTLNAQGEDSGRFWFRAIVLRDFKFSEENPNVFMRLLDIGGDIIQPCWAVRRLPKMFCQLPALAYKCSLFGINPLTHRWTKVAISTFKSMTETQFCLFEVKRTLPVVAEDPTQEPAYELQVLVKHDTDFVDMAQFLCSEGLALKWNLTPNRPLVSTSLDGELWNLLAAENDKPGGCIHITKSIKPADERIRTREMKRLAKLLGRLNVDLLEHEEVSEDESMPSSISNGVDDFK